MQPNVRPAAVAAGDSRKCISNGIRIRQLKSKTLRRAEGDHKYRVCEQTKNEPVASDPFCRCSNVRKYDKISSEFRVSFPCTRQPGRRRRGVRVGGRSPIPQAEALEHDAFRGRSTKIRRRHVSQLLEPFVVRANPFVVGALDGERLTLNACPFASWVVFALVPSLSLVTPDPCHSFLGSGLMLCIAESGGGCHRIARSREGAETTSKSG